MKQRDKKKKKKNEIDWVPFPTIYLVFTFRLVRFFFFFFSSSICVSQHCSILAPPWYTWIQRPTYTHTQRVYVYLWLSHNKVLNQRISEFLGAMVRVKFPLLFIPFSIYGTDDGCTRLYKRREKNMWNSKMENQESNDWIKSSQFHNTHTHQPKENSAKK